MYVAVGGHIHPQYRCPGEVMGHHRGSPTRDANGEAAILPIRRGSVAADARRCVVKESREQLYAIPKVSTFRSIHAERVLALIYFGSKRELLRAGPFLL